MSNAWDLTINQKKYTSGVDRDENSQQDKIAKKSFNLIENLDQSLKDNALPFHLPWDGTGRLSDPSGWTTEEQRFFDLPAKIKEDGGIKSISINFTVYIAPEINGKQLAGIQKSLDNVKSQIMTLYGKGATGVNNLSVNLEAVKNPEHKERNEKNNDPLKIKLTR